MKLPNLFEFDVLGRTNRYKHTPNGDAKHYTLAMRWSAKQAKKGFDNEVLYFGLFLLRAFDEPEISFYWKRRAYKAIHRSYLPGMLSVHKHQTEVYDIDFEPWNGTPSVKDIQQALDNYRTKRVKYPSISTPIREAMADDRD